MSNSDSSAQGFVDRLQSFVTENKRAIFIGTALAVAAGGAALYASASSSPKASGDKKNKKRSGKPKPRDVESGPIIEEIPVEDQPSAPSLTRLLVVAEVNPLSIFPRLWCSDQGTTRRHANRGAFRYWGRGASGSHAAL